MLINFVIKFASNILLQGFLSLYQPLKMFNMQDGSAGGLPAIKRCQVRKTKQSTVVGKSLLYFVLLYYSHKSWTIFKTRVSFEIYRSWRFQNTPYMCNLTKFWLRYLRLKTHDTILLFSWVLICWRWKLQKFEQFVPKIVLFTIKGTNINKNSP